MTPEGIKPQVPESVEPAIQSHHPGIASDIPKARSGRSISSRRCAALPAPPGGCAPT